MAKYCIRAQVSGKVQGVFYRQSTQQKAELLQITGWVKNNPDNTVELVACGEEKNIQQLIEWLWEGPSAANVTDVVWSAIPAENHHEFVIKR